MTWTIIGMVFGLGLALDDIWVRLLLRRARQKIEQYATERAEMTARALSDGTVLINGITYPAPDDSRWIRRSSPALVGRASSGCTYPAETTA